MGDLIRSIIRWIIVILIIILVVFLIIKITNKNETRKDLNNGVKTLKTITENNGINSNLDADENDENKSIITNNDSNTNTTNNTSTTTNQQQNTNSTSVTVSNTSTTSVIGVIGIVILFAGGYYIVRSRKAFDE